MDPQKLKALRVRGTYLSVMITKDVWDHVLVPCLTYHLVYRYSNYYHDFELYSSWIRGGWEVVPLQHIEREREHLVRKDQKFSIINKHQASTSQPDVRSRNH